MTPTPTDAAARIAKELHARLYIDTASRENEAEVCDITPYIRTALVYEIPAITKGLAELLRDYDVECGENECAEIANVIRAHLCGPAK